MILSLTNNLRSFSKPAACLQRTTSRFQHLEKFGQNCLSLSLVIQKPKTVLNSPDLLCTLNIWFFSI